jgi:hypothetical protein
MDEIECQKNDGKKRLQKSRYLVAQAKASKREGRKEEKYQLATELVCSIGTLLKCNIEKGKRKKDSSMEGGTKGRVVWILTKNSLQVSVHRVGLFS